MCRIKAKPTKILKCIKTLLKVRRKDACVQLKFHSICNHQEYYFYYDLKIAKICQNQYIKNTLSNETKNRKIQFCKSLFSHDSLT